MCVVSFSSSRPASSEYPQVEFWRVGRCEEERYEEKFGKSWQGVRPVSFSSDGTTVFCCGWWIVEEVGGGSSAFAQSVAFWRWG